MRQLTLQQFLLSVLILLSPCVVTADNNKTYILAVVPQLPTVEIYERWMPFVIKLSKELGANIQLKAYPSIPQFEADILKGVPDFAFMNPYHEVMAKNSQGYLPLIKDKADLVGILVVTKNSGINSIADLSGKEIAFPTPNAFAASLYMRALLANKGKVHFTPLYVKTHSNVYRFVALNKASAGGGVNNTFMRESEELKSQLKIIYTTPGSAPHPLSAHRRVPEAVRKRFIKTVLSLAEDKNNKDMFNNIQIPEPVAADYRRDYLPLEKLGLEKYVVMGTE